MASMTGQKTLIVGVTLIAVIAVLFLIGAVLTSGYLVKSRTARFLTELRTLSIGSRDTEQVLQWRADFRDSVLEDGPCSTEQCHLVFLFQNRIWKALRLPGSAQLVAGFEVDNHVVGYLTLAYAMETSNRRTSSVNVIKLNPGSGMSFKLVLQPRTPETVRGIVVYLSELATHDQQERTFALNLRCLAVPLACRDAYDLAPLLPKTHEVSRLFLSAGHSGFFSSDPKTLKTDAEGSRGKAD